MLITVLSYVGVGLVIIIIGFFIGFFYRKIVIDNKLNSAEDTAKRIINDAKKEADTIRKALTLSQVLREYQKEGYKICVENGKDKKEVVIT